jgi:CheY-like chemotaxis protein
VKFASSMKHDGTQKKRALLAGCELDVRQTLSRYLQLHGLDVVEVDSLQEAMKHLYDGENFNILVTEVGSPKQIQGYEWKTTFASESDGTLQVSALVPLDSLTRRIRAEAPISQASFDGFISPSFSRAAGEPFLSWNPYDDDPYLPDPYAPR